MKKIFIFCAMVIIAICTSCNNSSIESENKSEVANFPHPSQQMWDITPKQPSYYEKGNVEIFHGKNGSTIECHHIGDTLKWYFNQKLFSVEYGDTQIFYSEDGSLLDEFPRLNN